MQIKQLVAWIFRECQIQPLLFMSVVFLLLSILSCTKINYIDNPTVSVLSDGVMVSVTQIMSLDNTHGPQPQGGDCYGDLFFQFSSENTTVRVYDLLKKTLLCESRIEGLNRGFVPNCHCNSVCFGTSFYTEYDEFPLLYVSTGYGIEEYTGALVYRVIRQNDYFSFSLVQTIKFPKYGMAPWTEFIPGGEYCFLSYTSDYIVFKFQMPDANEGDIVLDYQDAIESFQFSSPPEWIYSSRNQDRFYHKGKIIYISGVPGAGEVSALVILDLSKKAYEHVFGFTQMGLYQEPESVFVWQGNICVAFVDRIVSFQFVPSLFST